MNARLIGLVLLGLLLSGCSPIIVEVNAYRSDLPFPDPAQEGPVYVEAQAEGEPALLSREVARTIARELESRGYACTPDARKAGYVLTTRVGTSRGRTVSETVPEPTTYHSTTHYYVGYRVGTIHTYGTDTAYAQRTYREFDHYLFMTLLDRKLYDAGPPEARDNAIIWQASCTCTNESRDLRDITRYMLAAAFNYFGFDTGRARRESFSPGSDEADRFDMAVEEGK